jgi:hypothetical protein
MVDMTMADEHNRAPPVEVLGLHSHTRRKRFHAWYGLDIVENEHMVRRFHKPATVLEIAQFGRRPRNREPDHGSDASQEQTGTPGPQQSHPLILASDSG